VVVGIGNGRSFGESSSVGGSLLMQAAREQDDELLGRKKKNKVKILRKGKEKNE